MNKQLKLNLELFLNELLMVVHPVCQVLDLQGFNGVLSTLDVTRLL